VPEGQIIGQSPAAGREVQSGTSVGVTVSSGPLTVEIPDLVGTLHKDARNILDAAGLGLGAVERVSSDEGAEEKIVKQHPAVGSRVERGTPVRVTVAQRQNEVLATEKSPKRRFYPRPDSLPDESEPRRVVESSSHRSEKRSADRGRRSEKPQDLPD
jgi:serine/threonine-protein kinase